MTRPTLFGPLLIAGLTACPKPPTLEAGVGSGATAPAGDGDAGEQVAMPDPGASAHDKLARAVELVATGQETSVRRGLGILQELPAQTYPEVAYNMGVAYQELGQLTSAKKSYLQATQLDPTIGNAWLNLGVLAEGEGNSTQALNYYRTGLEKDPTNGGLVVGLVGALRKLGRHDEAISEAKRALERNANNVGAYNNLGLVYLDQGKTDLALFIYQKALNTIDGAEGNAYLHANLGRVYLAQEKKGDARKELERALELDPDLVVARVLLAEMALDNRDYDAAVAMLEGARDTEASNAGIHMNLGIAYRGQGRYEEAKRSYERAIELDSGNPAPWVNIGILQADYLEDYSGALQSFGKYKNGGGKQTALVDEYIADVEMQKERIRRAEERRKRSDDRKKRQEERERLAAEHEARAAEEAAAAEKAAAEEPAPEQASPDNEPSPEPEEEQPEGGESTGDGGWGGGQ